MKYYIQKNSKKNLGADLWPLKISLSSRDCSITLLCKIIVTWKQVFFVCVQKLLSKAAPISFVFTNKVGPHFKDITS